MFKVKTDDSSGSVISSSVVASCSQDWEIPLPSVLVQYSLFSKLGIYESAMLATSSSQFSSLSPYKNAKHEFFKRVDLFFQLVAHGKQIQAEIMLKDVPELLLMKADVNDYSGRTFKNITAYQYALWARDSEMCKMFTTYLSKETMRLQLDEFKTVGVSYEVFNPDTSFIDVKKEHHFNADKIINALTTFQDFFKGIPPFFQPQGASRSNWLKSANKHECNRLLYEIGRAQRLMPAWLAQVYSHGLSSITSPTPLLRRFSTSFSNIDIFPLDQSPSYQLGVNCALFSHHWGFAHFQTEVLNFDPEEVLDQTKNNITAINKLITIKVNQLVQHIDLVEDNESVSHGLI